MRYGTNPTSFFVRLSGQWYVLVNVYLELYYVSFIFVKSSEVLRVLLKCYR